MSVKYLGDDFLDILKNIFGKEQTTHSILTQGTLFIL